MYIRTHKVGCFTGYSALAMASALGDEGRVYTIERDAEMAGVARENFAQSPWADRIALAEGDAVEILRGLARGDGGAEGGAGGDEEGRGDEGEGVLPAGMAAGEFDLVFVDANKKQYSNYFKLVLDGGLLRVGGVLVERVREGICVWISDDAT